MKQALYFFVIFYFLFQKIGLSKESFQLDAMAGISYPSDPFAFRTFWSDGISFQLKVLFPSKSNYQSYIAAEYNRFVFDEKSFFTSLHMGGNNSKVFGATASIVSFSGGVSHTLEKFDALQPYLFAGLAVVCSIVNSGTVEYPYVKKNQEGQSKFFISIPFGIECKYPFSESMSIKISAKYNLGLKRFENVNTNYYTVTFGTVFDL
jgi:hypothetical protein